MKERRFERNVVTIDYWENPVSCLVHFPDHQSLAGLSAFVEWDIAQFPEK
jgi:hypothetical protein